MVALHFTHDSWSALEAAPRSTLVPRGAAEPPAGRTDTGSSATVTSRSDNASSDRAVKLGRAADTAAPGARLAAGPDWLLRRGNGAMGTAPRPAGVGACPCEPGRRAARVASTAADGAAPSRCSEDGGRGAPWPASNDRPCGGAGGGADRGCATCGGADRGGADWGGADWGGADRAGADRAGAGGGGGALGGADCGDAGRGDAGRGDAGCGGAVRVGAACGGADRGGAD